MKKLCPNFDREDALDIVLEVPMPEEIIAAIASSGAASPRQVVSSWLGWPPCAASLSGRTPDIQILLKVVGSPLVAFPIPTDLSHGMSIRNCSSIQASTAKYIVQQYMAATGGQAALNAVESMYALGKVTMRASEFQTGDEKSDSASANTEVGGFVLWQKSPDLWYLELILSNCKLSTGCDGKLAWRQSTTEQSNVTRGPPRPLRRILQGLDPKSTAALFSDAVCIGEKVINNEDCFILKLEASTEALRARSGNNFEIIHHTIWGYFSQRTGLLTQLEDCHLTRMKANKRGESIFWETSMESTIEDYRYIDGINIAHGGRTLVTLFRYGEGSANHKRMMEEIWAIQEVDFNLRGLSIECFLPPADLKREHDGDQNP